MRSRLLPLLTLSISALFLAAEGAPSYAQSPNPEMGVQNPSATMPPPATRRHSRAALRAGQFASAATAQAHCPGDTVVWANTKSHVYHLSGTAQYGKTKHGAYMCKADTTAAGMRAAREPKKRSL
jgi:hypothetical protein